MPDAADSADGIRNTFVLQCVTAHINAGVAPEVHFRATRNATVTERT